MAKQYKKNVLKVYFTRWCIIFPCAKLTKNEIVLRNLGVSDFLVHGVAVVGVSLGAVAQGAHASRNLARVPVEGDTHRHHHYLHINTMINF